jgi:hypothetical protein
MINAMSTPEENEAAIEARRAMYEAWMEAMISADNEQKEDEEDVGDRPFSTVSSIQPDPEVSANYAATENVEAGRGGAVPRQGRTVRRVNTMFAAPSWRTHSTGVLYLMVEMMRQYGSVMLSQEDLERLHRSVPPMDPDVDVMPVMLLTLQTMQDEPGMKVILRAWSNRLGLMVIDGPAASVPTRLPPPNETPMAWNFGIWSLAVQVVQSFANQNLPGTDVEFLRDISDICRDAGMNAWAVEVMALTLYFVQRSSWCWEVLFGY